MVKGLLTTAAVLFCWVWIFAVMSTPYTPAQLERKKARSASESAAMGIAGGLLWVSLLCASGAALWWGWT